MDPRATVIVVAFIALMVFAVASAVVFWRNGQVKPTLREWGAHLRRGSVWHITAALSGGFFVATLVFMRLSGGGA